MGQYYRGAIIKIYKNGKVRVRKAFCCYSHDNGAKLMEHSYVGNYYVKEYEKALATKFYGSQFVWVGDYADRSEIYDTACKYIEDKLIAIAKRKGYELNLNSFRKWGEEFIKFVDGKEITASETQFYEKTNYNKLKDYKYIINLSKKEYVEIPTKTNDLLIHPLPLLCCDGNGRGGGDYYGSDMKMIGIWAYDCIGIGNEIPDGYTKRVVNFKEK